MNLIKNLTIRNQDSIMKESPRKFINFNKIKPSNLNRTQMSIQKDTPVPASRFPYSMSTKYNREPSISFSTEKTETNSSKNQALQMRNFQNKTFEGQKLKRLVFELKCEDPRCDEDSNTIASNDGYSFKSYEKKNPGIHNHRKIGLSTEYIYAEDEVPQIYEEVFNRNERKEPEKDEESQKRFPYPKLGKITWRFSPFAPIFGNKHPQLQSNNLQRYVENEEIRQKKELQKYELEREIEFEKKKAKQANKIVLKRGTKLQNKEKSFGFDGVLDSDRKNMKTRLQQKQQALSGFEVSNKAEPGNQGKYCYPCKVKFEDYWEHIKLSEHKMKLKICLGTDLFLEEIHNIEDKNREEKSSEEYRYLMELDKYLERVVQSLEGIIAKKNIELNQKFKKIKEQVSQWAKQ